MSDDPYRDATEWREEKTMEHASGIWGRDPMLVYLEEHIVKKGDVIVDLGCGTGYPTYRLSCMVGWRGRVHGFDSSVEMLTEAMMYVAPPVLTFAKADITRSVPIAHAAADAVTAFMVIHSMSLAGVRQVFKETARILKDSGTAVFLTQHPETFASEWDMDFVRYDAADLSRFRRALSKEDLVLNGVAKNAGGGEKKIRLVHHSRLSVLEAAASAGLRLTDERHFTIDAATALKKFGENSFRKLPETPFLWMFVLRF